jgi:hypothetical protein
VDVLLPDDLCVPPAAHYHGAVRPHSRAAHWIPTTLSVREDRMTGRRSVQVPRDLQARCGEPIGIRFYRERRVPAQSIPGGTVSDTWTMRSPGPTQTVQKRRIAA